MRLSDLNDEQQLLLAGWFILADAFPPERGEELPVEAQQALVELSLSTGKYHRSKMHRGTVIRSGNKRISQPARTGLLHGKRRKVRASTPMGVS